MLISTLEEIEVSPQEGDSTILKIYCIMLFTIHIVSNHLYRKCISEMHIEKIKLVNHVG